MTILEYLISNAIVVAVLAVIAWGVFRWLRKPGLAHIVWIVLLIKLVTPPLIQLPIDFRTNPTAAAKTEAPREQLANQIAEVTPGREATEFATDDVASAMTAEPAESLASSGLKGLSRTNQLVSALVMIWISGGLIYLTVLLYRQIRFWRYLRSNELIDVDLVGEGYDLAWQMGLANPPLVRILGGAISPMLCGLGRGVTLIIPAELSDRLSPESRATLITHELAHFQRRDHWVRVLEGVVTTLFWWNPAVWFIRHHLHIAEEECVDARVVAEFPSRPRQYAEALLDTIDFMSERRVVLPPMASGLGSAPLIRYRLTRIMETSDQPNAAGRNSRTFAFCAAALLILPLGVVGSDFRSNTISHTNNLAGTDGSAHTQFDVEVEVVSPSGEFRLERHADGNCRTLRADGSVGAELPNVSTAVFISDQIAVLGSSDGFLTAINCEDGTQQHRVDTGGPIKSLDWSEATGRLAVVTSDSRLQLLDKTLHVRAERNFTDAQIGGARFSQSGEVLLLPISESYTTTLVQLDGTESTETTELHSLEILDRRNLLSVQTCDLEQAVAFARFVGDQGEVVAYGDSGRVTLFTPGPLTPVKVDWLPNDAIAALRFSPQVNHATYVPESF